VSAARHGATAAAILGAAALATATVVKWEGWALSAYPDIGRVWTICAGDTDGVKPGQKATDLECESRLGRAAVRIGFEIAPCLPHDLPIETRAAFISAAYNIGPGAFCGSSMSRQARAGDLAGACRALDLWNKAGRDGGALVVIRGLTLRRSDERRLCEAGLRP
jgi:lysozyme